jgi:quinoprotein glucose dehydrogenase
MKNASIGISLALISLSNVDRLERVWTWETGEEPIPMARVPLTGQPVTPGRFDPTSYNQVVAINPDTGKELWRYDPKAYEWGRPFRGCGFCHRGVAVWTRGDEIRVFINTRWRLIALDGKTGLPIESFGNGGEVDLTKDLAWEVNRLHYSNTAGRAGRHPGLRRHHRQTRLGFSHDSAGRRVRQ